jgi:hypothetical protein
MNNEQSPAGFYPDPAGGPARRWFDGVSWADHYEMPPPPRRFTIHYGFALLAVLSVIGTLLFGFPMVAAAMHRDPDTGQASGVGILMTMMWFGWGGMWTLIWTAFAVNHTLKVNRGWR